MKQSVHTHHLTQSSRRCRKAIAVSDLATGELVALEAGCAEAV